MSKLEYTSPTAIEAKYQDAYQGFHSGITQSLDFRRDQLRNLYYALTDNERDLKEALTADMHRSSMETDILEYTQCLSEIALAIEKVGEWAKDEYLPTLTGDVRFALSGAKLRKSPYGVVLIIGPWNYPYLCTILPIVSAIAAGNSVVLKPTEMAPNSTRVLARVLEQALDPRVLRVVVGAVSETTQLLNMKWDKIMLTGSGRVGKIVSHAAADNLTPICLELGGKSPVIISRTANLKLAAKRLAWAKFLNAGQTCIAPDYVIIDHDVAPQFVEHLKSAIRTLYPDIGASGSEGRDFGHIISERLFDRASQIVEKSGASEKWQWGKPNKKTNFFPPTIVYGGLTPEDAVMEDELFNPILPVLEVDNVFTKACSIIKSYHDYPLALYVFTGKNSDADTLIRETRSGSVMINDAVMFGGSPVIPFGGVGASGVGRYHGKYGFDEFTHERPVVTTPTWAEALIAARYPPYTSFNATLLRKLGRFGNATIPRTGKIRTGSGLSWLIGFIIRKFGITIIVLALIYHFR